MRGARDAQFVLSIRGTDVADVHAMNPTQLLKRACVAIILCAHVVACGNDRSVSRDAGALDDAVLDAAIEDASADASTVVEDLGVDAAASRGFGDPCTLDGVIPCDDGLLCISPAGNDGFCSKNCTRAGAQCPGAPEGTTAYCIVGEEGTPNGQKGCAFLCRGGGSDFECPGTLACASFDEPPGSGQRLCLP